MCVEDVSPVVPEYDGHQWQINEFLDWLDGGAAPDTCLEHNIRSVVHGLRRHRSFEDGRVDRRGGNGRAGRKHRLKETTGTA